jgi:hypothetical protein
MDIGAFSYRLKIAVEPQWAEIIKQVVGLRDYYEQKEFAKKLTDLPDDRMLHPVVIALRKTPHHRQPLRPGASGCRFFGPEQFPARGLDHYRCNARKCL